MIRTSARSAVPAARFGALGLAAILVLGGCSGSGDEPAAEAAENESSSASASGSSGPTETATPSATPTPTSAAYKPATAEGPAENVPLPVLPELAKEESAEGLEAFATHWYALMNYGFETGDVEPMKRISGPDCVVCGNVYRLLGNGYDEQDWIFGGELVVMSTKSNYVVTSKGVYQVLIQIRQDPYEYRGPGDVLYGENDGVQGTTVQMIEATYNNGQWFATDAVTIQ